MRANCETRAEGCLRAVGFEVYFPQVREERRGRRGKRIVVKRPMFACYIFLQITGVWRPVLSIPSVTQCGEVQRAGAERRAGLRHGGDPPPRG
jgi:hypothetical protein